MPEQRYPRAEVPTEQTWDLASVYPSDDAWEAPRAKHWPPSPPSPSWQRQLATAPDALLEALRARDQWTTVGWRLRQYANMQVKADASDTRRHERLQRANNPRSYQRRAGLDGAGNMRAGAAAAG